MFGFSDRKIAEVVKNTKNKSLMIVICENMYDSKYNYESFIKIYLLN